MQKVVFDHGTTNESEGLLGLAGALQFKTLSRRSGAEEEVARELGRISRATPDPVLSLVHISSDGLKILLDELAQKDIIVRLAGTGSRFDITPPPQPSKPLLLYLRQRVSEIDEHLLKVLGHELSNPETVAQLRSGQLSAVLLEHFRFRPLSLLRSLYFLTFIPIYAPIGLRSRAGSAAWWLATLSSMYPAGAGTAPNADEISSRLLSGVAFELGTGPEKVKTLLPKTAQLIHALNDSFDPLNQDWQGIQSELADFLTR